MHGVRLLTVLLLLVAVQSRAQNTLYQGVTLLPGVSLPDGQRVDSGSDVTLDDAAVALDLFPTFVAVSATFALVGGAEGETGLTMGFPLQLGDRPNAVLRNVIVFVDGMPLGNTKLKNGSRLWTLDIPPKKRVEINIRYSLIFGVSREIDLGYQLGTGGLWKGPIRRSRVLLNLHNVPHDAVKSLGLSPSEPRPMRWLVENSEPKGDIRLKVSLPKMSLDEALEKAPNYISNQPVTPLQTWIDAVIRLQRVGADHGETPDWISRYYDRLIEGLESDSALANVEAERLLTLLAADWKAAEHTATGEDEIWCRDGLFKFERTQMPWPALLEVGPGTAMASHSDGLIRACVARIEHNRTRFRGLLTGLAVLFGAVLLLLFKRRQRKKKA